MLTGTASSAASTTIASTQVAIETPPPTSGGATRRSMTPSRASLGPLATRPGCFPLSREPHLGRQLQRRRGGHRQHRRRRDQLDGEFHLHHPHGRADGECHLPGERHLLRVRLDRDDHRHGLLGGFDDRREHRGGNRGHQRDQVVEWHRLCCQQPDLRGGHRHHDLDACLGGGKPHLGRQLQRYRRGHRQRRRRRHQLASQLHLRHRLPSSPNGERHLSG